MAMNKIPQWKDRQKILYAKEKSDPKRLVELGSECLKAGYIQDAFEYFQSANDAEGLGKIRSLALEEGDAFLLGSTEKHVGAVSDDVWNKLGYRAFELGKYRFAKTAFEKTKNEIMLAKIRATLGEVQPPPADEAPSTV